MRASTTMRGAVIGATTLGLLASAAAIAPSAHARPATEGDFWAAAADAATATIYAPTRQGLEGAGLAPLPEPTVGQASLSMVCGGQWNVTATYDARRGDGSATITEATPSCTPDFGVGSATGSWTFPAQGRTFTIRYLDCRGTSEGASTPAIADCRAADVIYAVDGRLPAAGGKAPTFVHIETLGLTRPQIRTLVRSLEAVG